jgi:hypothetical protein
MGCGQATFDQSVVEKYWRTIQLSSWDSGAIFNAAESHNRTDRCGTFQPAHKPAG